MGGAHWPPKTEGASWVAQGHIFIPATRFAKARVPINEHTVPHTLRLSVFVDTNKRQGGGEEEGKMTRVKEGRKLPKSNSNPM